MQLLEEKDLSRQTIRNIVATLSALFNFAMAPRRRWATSNPCAGVELPAVPETGEIRFLTLDELDALVGQARPGEFHALDRAIFLTAAMTGLRKGELLALRWKDVDWLAARVRVRQNYVRGEFGTPLGWSEDGDPPSRSERITYPEAARAAGRRRLRFTTPGPDTGRHPSEVGGPALCTCVRTPLGRWSCRRAWACASRLITASPSTAATGYTMEVTSAETNVASISSFLGLPVKVLTAFVKESPIAAFIKNDLAARHMAYEGPEVPPGSAWGYRHQFNIADSGVGKPGPARAQRSRRRGRPHVERQGLRPRSHLRRGRCRRSSTSPVSSPRCLPTSSQFCLEVARAAKRHGTRISFDLNYRASFWAGREGELKRRLRRDRRRGGHPHRQRGGFPSPLGAQGPAAGGDDVASKIDGFKDMIGRVKDAYPNASG